tara:strand:- start:14820 stop:16538 length:1719 start_codon:yes stop_codon:yes gene_type:complete
MRRFQPLFLLALSFFIFSNAIAQTSGNTSSQNSLNISSSNGLGGFYFQDPTGLQLAIEGLTYEGSIDKATYILGPNDLISIQIETIQNMVLRGLLINASGEVIIPSIGSVNINSLTVLEAERVITEAASVAYKKPIISISVEIPRPVNIHVNGAIPSPGKFVLPAQTRVDLAIFLATMSLPKKSLNDSLVLAPQNTSQLLDEGIYSYRNISITHSNGEKSTADLISYFRAGDLQGNPIIRDGDQITIKMVTPRTPTVSISGAVNYGYELEYKKGDTPASLLAISGGFEESADRSKIIVYRRQTDTVEMIELGTNEWANFELAPNDRIVVPYDRSKPIQGSAWVLGEVKIPGSFPIVTGKTSASDLLNLSGGLTDEALPASAYLIRGTRFENEIPNKFNASLMLRTSDQLVEGVEYFESETRLSQNRVFLDLGDIDQLQQLKIFSGDSLYIPKDEHTIFIFGQVNKPGYFPYLSSSVVSVNEYISKAGGFALAADEDRVFIIKAGSGAWYKPNEAQLESGDRIFVDKQPVVEFSSKQTYEYQRGQLKNQRVQLWLAGISTITGIITTYVALNR